MSDSYQICGEIIVLADAYFYTESALFLFTFAKGVLKYEKAIVFLSVFGAFDGVLVYGWHGLCRYVS